MKSAMSGRKTRTQVRLAALPTALLLFAVTACAQASHMSAGDARISGHVRDAATDQPLTAVRVEVSAAGSGVADVYVTTGTDGEFNIAGVKDGNFDISINEKGYKPYRESITLVNGNFVMLTIPLEKAPPEAEAPAGVLSAHELTVPQKAHDLYMKGMALKAKPDYAGALEQFQKATKQFPTYYEAYAEAGVAEVNLNQLDAAQKDLQKSIDLSDGKYALAMFYMAGLLNNKRAFDDALAIGKKGYAIDDNSWRGNFEIARALIGLKRGDEALPYAKKAVEADPANSQMYVVLMNANIASHDYPAALATIDTFLKLNGTGQQADQVRQLRGQIQAAIQKQQAKAAAAANSSQTTAPASSAPAPTSTPH
jgi:outer membrane protein assembly factor BamD (BamD/ComL family)